MRAARRPRGRVRLLRSLLLGVPCLLAALMMVPAIALGWIPIAIGTANPLAVRTDGGHAESLYLGGTTTVAITGTDPMSRGARPSALVYTSTGPTWTASA